MKTSIGRTLITLTSLILLMGLQSCTTVITSSAQAAYDHKSIQDSVQDHLLAVRVDRAVHWYSDKYKTSNVAVSVFNNTVILTGEVPSADLRTALTALVKKVPDISHVYNLTAVSNTVSTLTQMSDAWITTKVKSQIIAEIELDPGKIKVITENGTVYLVGIVFPEQAEIAVDIARSTSGVQNVVKIFSYLEITKHPAKPKLEQVG